MPKGGHNKKPTALKVLEGNPGKRPIPKHEPKPEPVAPKCPSWLNKIAKAEWRRISPLLATLGLITREDMANLAGYCHSYAQMIEAEDYLAKHGLGYVVEQRNKAGELISMSAGEYAQMRTVRNAKSEIIRYSAMFGLSPVDRSRMSVPGASISDDDDFASLLSGGVKNVRPRKSR